MMQVMEAAQMRPSLKDIEKMRWGMIRLFRGW